MAHETHFPRGSWPAEMRAATAAAYYDEPSVESFLRKVALGVYPPPFSQKGALPKWHRAKLDQNIDRRHGIVSVSSAGLVEDAVELM